MLGPGAPPFDQRGLGMAARMDELTDAGPPVLRCGAASRFPCLRPFEAMSCFVTPVHKLEPGDSRPRWCCLSSSLFPPREDFLREVDF